MPIKYISWQLKAEYFPAISHVSSYNFSPEKQTHKHSSHGVSIKCWHTARMSSSFRGFTQHKWLYVFQGIVYTV